MYFRFVCLIYKEVKLLNVPGSDRRCNWKIKQKFYAAFGEAFTGFSAFDTVQDQIQPVWQEHTRPQPLNRDPVLAMEWIFILATPNGLIFGAKTCETHWWRKTKTTKETRDHKTTIKPQHKLTEQRESITGVYTEVNLPIQSYQAVNL